jgi:hypothetical protein
MGSILAMAFIMLVGLGLAVVSMYLLYKMLTNFPPSHGRMQRDLQKLKADISVWFGDLVPWDADEMERLSFNQLNRKVSKGMVTTGKGIFTSIYHEPMIAYSFKKYVGKKQEVLLYARTSHHEYAYHLRGNEAEVWMDSQPLARLRTDGTLVGPRNQVLGRLQKSAENKLLPAVVNDKEVANLVNPALAARVNPRAFEFLKPMQPDEEAVLLALAIPEMVRQDMA